MRRFAIVSQRCVIFGNGLYLLLQEIDPRKVPEPLGIKSQPAVPWLVASSPKSAEGQCSKLVASVTNLLVVGKKASQKFSWSLRPSCYCSLLSGVQHQRSQSSVDRPLFAKKIQNFQALQIRNSSTSIRPVTHCRRRQRALSHKQCKKFCLTTKFPNFGCTLLSARKNSQDVARSHTGFQKSQTSINVNFLKISPKTLPQVGRICNQQTSHAGKKFLFPLLIVFY